MSDGIASELEDNKKEVKNVYVCGQNSIPNGQTQVIKIDIFFLT